MNVQSMTRSQQTELLQTLADLAGIDHLPSEGEANGPETEAASASDEDGTLQEVEAS